MIDKEICEALCPFTRGISCESGCNKHKKVESLIAERERKAVEKALDTIKVIQIPEEECTLNGNGMFGAGQMNVMARLHTYINKMEPKK